MLLPSALPCDMRQRSSDHLATSRLFSTPPPSSSSSSSSSGGDDDDGDLPVGNGLLGTCRALQSLLNGSPASSPGRAKPKKRLQSPAQIRSGSLPPSFSVRSSRKVKGTVRQQQQKQQRSSSTTPTAPPNLPRGVSKRRRDVYEGGGNDDRSSEGCNNYHHRHHHFSTPAPKRRRHVPFDLPLGLSEDDFYSLHTPSSNTSQRNGDYDVNVDVDHFDSDSIIPSMERERENTDDSTSTDNNNNNNNMIIQPSSFMSPTPSINWTSNDNNNNNNNNFPEDPESEWTSGDDRILVDLVLERFRLSRRDWEECARRMGKDDIAGVGRRWEVLVGKGNVGLRRSMRSG